MVLVSLLVDQLYSLFLSFFGRPKKNCSVSGNFWSVSNFFLVRLWFFGILKRNFGIPKRNLVDQKIQSLTKNSLRLNKFFFGRPKKGRKRPNNWSTKRLTKTTWTGLLWLKPSQNTLRSSTWPFFCFWIGNLWRVWTMCFSCVMHHITTWGDSSSEDYHTRATTTHSWLETALEY